MVSGIGAIGSTGSSFGVSAVQSILTAQTRAQLESLGIDITNIKTEAEGQSALQSAQSTQQGQKTQKSHGAKGHKAGGGNAASQAIKQETMALAEQLGISVPSDAKLSEIMDAISQAITDMQAKAGNDPEKIAQVAQYQATFQALGQAINNLQSSKQSSSGFQSGASQLQTSMSALASYNMASISIASNATNNISTTTKH